MGPPVFLSFHHYLEDARIVERYRAGELSPSELQEFEAHFVDCQECRDRLTLDQLFHRPTPASDRPEFAAAHPPPPPPTRKPAEGAGAVFTPLAFLAPLTQLGIFIAGAILLAALPALLVAYQYRQIKAAEEIEVLLSPNTAQTHAVPFHAEFVDFKFDVPVEPGIYQVSLVQVQGTTMLRLPDQLGPFQSVRLPATMLPSAEYWLYVEARRGDGTVNQYRAYSLTIERTE